MTLLPGPLSSKMTDHYLACRLDWRYGSVLGKLPAMQPSMDEIRESSDNPPRVKQNRTKINALQILINIKFINVQ